VGALLPPGPHGGDVVDLNRALAVLHALEDVGAPEAQADSLLPTDTQAFLRQLARALPAAQRALEFVAEASERYDAPDLLRAGVILPRRSVRLAAPVPRPGKILAVARNYAAHAAEAGGTAPPEPVLFLKASSSVIGPEDEIVLPRQSQAVDYEGELAVVIGRVARHLTEESALTSVAGYTVANDVSARDYQNVRGQHFIGKSCDTFAPLGPALVTQDEIPDPHDLSIRTFLSGELVQSARTKEMIFPIARILAFASKLMTLEPGDVLLTGTPAGVGMARKPPRYLRDGDVVDVEIERVGRLRSFVALERA
jgi:acylpyruvate hydrolase